MKNVDLLIIGGGPAGLAAAKAAYEEGCRDMIILEREDSLGGILKQCIHNGFGLHTFKEELTGPEYAQRFIDKIKEYGIPHQLNTMVIEVTPQKTVTCVSREFGLEQFCAKSIVLAMGCRERPRGSLGTPGWRCAGIYTAGTAQKLVNLQGLMPGKRVVILGSGDIGLIMARRMTFSGAKVLGCVELMPYSAGLKRNIVQCLDDFEIPLYLSHTVTDIEGRERLSGVTIAQVDDSLKPIRGTEKHFDCDTLLLSVGLIPENELSSMAGVEISPATSGPVVDDRLQSSVEGVFACGNVLHVHDLVDFVSEESERAGKNAAAFISKALAFAGEKLEIKAGCGVNAIVPQFISKTVSEPTTVMFRPRAVYKNATVRVMAGECEIAAKKCRVLAPGEIVTLKIPADYIKKAERAESLEIMVEA
ncbi:MAG: FAD-dependent oxidoreductase [Oscillospiraceae bacterium]